MQDVGFLYIIRHKQYRTGAELNKQITIASSFGPLKEPKKQKSNNLISRKYVILDQHLYTRVLQIEAPTLTHYTTHCIIFFSFFPQQIVSLKHCLIYVAYIGIFYVAHNLQL